MTNSPEIAVIIPYFGQMPAISVLFFHSCRFNLNIRFLLFTDQAKPSELPENIKYFAFTLKQFNKLAGKKLGVRINIRYPYKLCDFKPMYGRIFEDYLRGYKLWGYCDLDMVFGKSELFLTAEILDNFDIITARKETLAGNFTLYKNNDALKNLYLQSDCWKMIVQNPWRVYSFPEKFKPEGKPVSKRILYRFLKVFHKPDFRFKIAPDMNAILSSQAEIKVYFGDFMLSDMLLRNKGINRWELNWGNGFLTENFSKRNYLYFHFYFLKNNTSYNMSEKINYKSIKSFVISSESLKIIY